MRMTVLRMIVGASVLSSFATVGTVAAQSFDILPHPMDRLNGPPVRSKGACDSDYYNSVGKEVQAIYNRYGRCDEYSKSLYADYVIWVKQEFDPDDGRDYGGGALGDYQNVPSYFAWYGIEWWDGRTSPGYVEEARYGSTLAPGLTPTFPVLARSTSEKVDVQFSDARPAGPARRAAPTGGTLGACGMPVANEAQRQEQAIYAKYGTCDTIKASWAGGR